jgi:hypothetical protein
VVVERIYVEKPPKRVRPQDPVRGGLIAAVGLIPFGLVGLLVGATWPGVLLIVFGALCGAGALLSVRLRKKQDRY